MPYFVRRGEGQANVDGVFTGIDCSAPLTRLGRQQAQPAGRAILDIGDQHLPGSFFSPGGCPEDGRDH